MVTAGDKDPWVAWPWHEQRGSSTSARPSVSKDKAVIRALASHAPPCPLERRVSIVIWSTREIQYYVRL